MEKGFILRDKSGDPWSAWPGRKFFPGKDSAKPVECARAVSELVCLHPHAVKEGKVEVAQGGFLGGPQTAAGAEGAACAI